MTASWRQITISACLDRAFIKPLLECHCRCAIEITAPKLPNIDDNSALIIERSVLRLSRQHDHVVGAGMVITSLPRPEGRCLETLHDVLCIVNEDSTSIHLCGYVLVFLFHKTNELISLFQSVVPCSLVRLVIQQNRSAQQSKIDQSKLLT